ncbi:hypothetical protein SALGADO_13 [Arthrobacter phage Salgado]|uniref:Uncharacterized protein n=2 Tax=Laroyevirus TaxID=1982086 RepID=A0A0U4JDS9_9CAUD|nr:hypothetical protein KMD21_gp13 [Arthrobacter phage LiSara]YP_010082622.1 hypothetical protein KMD22_gp13 [Arthrobacter phage Salgado]ALY10181.1 hypothetical protein SALGADO_13 [Arthrobacter phage Salgado]ASR83597.1 hypothetical protein SEA_LISARA_13 [Arthrobacter phage LiSara]
MTAVVNLDEYMPVPLPEPEPEVIDMAMEIVMDDVKFQRDQIAKRGRRHAWKNRPMRNLTARLDAAAKSSDPYGSLMTYLDELMFLENEMRQVIQTVREITGDDV